MRWFGFGGANVSGCRLTRRRRRGRFYVALLRFCSLFSFIYVVVRRVIIAAPVDVVRMIPRTARELRRNFGLNWAARIKTMRLRNNYEVPRDVRVTIRIISLDRSQERGGLTANNLSSQGTACDRTERLATYASGKQTTECGLLYTWT